MTKFFWKISFALHLKNFVDVPLSWGWKVAQTSWEDNVHYGLSLSAKEAAREEACCIAR